MWVQRHVKDYETFADLAMWVQRHFEDYEIYFQKLGRVTEKKAGAKGLFIKMIRLEYTI